MEDVDFVVLEADLARRTSLTGNHSVISALPIHIWLFLLFLRLRRRFPSDASS